MRYELNFDEDKIIDIEAIGDNSVLDLKDCCKLLNELNEENQGLKQLIKRMGELGGFNKHMIKTICGD